MMLRLIMLDFVIFFFSLFLSFLNIQGEEGVLQRAKEARCTCTANTFMVEMESLALRYVSEVYEHGV